MPTTPLYSRRSWRPDRAAIGVVTLLAAAAVIVVPAGVASAVPTTAPTGTSCNAANIYVNTGGGEDVLNVYTPSGTEVSSVPLADDFGDIAFNADGSILYGIVFSGPGARLAEIDPATGGVTNTSTISGAVANDSAFNSLSGLPSGDLLAGTPNDATLYDINPVTHTSTIYPASLPAAHVAAGDFLTLSDGDIAALTVSLNTGATDLVRIHPDNSTTIVGTVPNSYGMAQSGDALFLAGSDGVIRRLETVPTAASSSALTTTNIVDTGLPLYGATSVQDSGQCNVLTASASPASVTRGTRVTLTVSGLPDGATGTVTFTSGGRPLCTVTLPASTCTTPAGLAAATYHVVATYSATDATATTTFTVTRTHTRVHATAGAATVSSAGRTSLAVSGLPAGATGTVRFTVHGTTLCTVTLPATSCTTPSNLATGTYRVTATYSGDANFDQSSATTTFTVRAAAGTAPLSDTGAPTRTLLIIGLSLLFGGAALLGATRRRPRRAHP